MEVCFNRTLIARGGHSLKTNEPVLLEYTVFRILLLQRQLILPTVYSGGIM